METAAERLRSGARVLSVTGYGGTGKTRFSIELFRRLAGDFAGGAALVPLAAVTAASEVMTVVAGTLDVPEAAGRSALDAAEGRNDRAIVIAAAAEALSQRAGVVIAPPRTRDSSSASRRSRRRSRGATWTTSSRRRAS